jgi:hypothetical protein
MANTALHVTDDQERPMLAIGRYVGEGFDDARLDTLFLTMSIAWRGHRHSMSAVHIANVMARRTFWWLTTSITPFRFWLGWQRSAVWAIGRWAM